MNILQLRFPHLASTGIIAAAALFAGCASSRAQGPEIEDQWLARVPQEDMAPIEEARQEKRRASDELRREQAAAADAEARVSVAEERLEAAQQAVEVAQARIERATQLGDRETLTSADQAMKQARAELRLSEEKLQLAQRTAALAQARAERAQLEVRHHDLEVEREKYRALREVDDTRVDSIVPAEFDVALSENEVARARKSQEVDALERALSDAQHEVEQLEKEAEEGRG